MAAAAAPVERLTVHTGLAPFLKFPKADPRQLGIARQVFLELFHVQGWASVSPHFCEPLGLVYIVGRPVKGKPREFILPTARDAALSMEAFARLFDVLAGGHCDADGGANGCASGRGTDEAAGAGAAAGDGDEASEDLVRDAIVVAIVDSDSTCAMYRMFRGLRPPPASAIVEEPS